MHEMEAQFGFTPGKPVARVKASDMKTLWKLSRELEARVMAHNPEFKRGQRAIGMGVVRHSSALALMSMPCTFVARGSRC